MVSEDTNIDNIEGRGEERAAERVESAPSFRRERRPTGGGARRGGGGRRSFRPRRKVCSFCVDKVTFINYKDVDSFRRFVDRHGKIIPRRKTGTCAKHQRRLALAIKRARHLALLPFAAGRTPYSER